MMKLVIDILDLVVLQMPFRNKSSKLRAFYFTQKLKVRWGVLIEKTLVK